MTTIVPFRAEHADVFYALNRAWLDAHELYEPHDEEHLGDPKGSIIDPGGAVFVALNEAGTVVGTAAVAPCTDPDALELVKLTVAESARGAGLGRRLANTCISHARQSGARRLVLVSSSKLESALRLYESMGWKHKPLPADVPYETADVYMELELDT